ncbi:hypothetical_protein [Leishmania infantum]|uniref:Hypothetical_protein n=1 Tax=Leishmania infantum TaxID=5671 RepID=A0A6L0WNP8_LEIIN|nr:hypothetical_protein [Leishmania infantum]SUZ39639.1 hypothetical_protein [Leishmania infantum]
MSSTPRRHNNEWPAASAAHRHAQCFSASRVAGAAMAASMAVRWAPLAKAQRRATCAIRTAARAQAGKPLLQPSEEGGGAQVRDRAVEVIA